MSMYRVEYAVLGQLLEDVGNFRAISSQSSEADGNTDVEYVNIGDSMLVPRREFHGDGPVLILRAEKLCQ